MITLTAAEIYRVDDRFDVNTADYVAEVVVREGAPLEIMPTPGQEIVDDEKTDLASCLTRLRGCYADMDDTTRFGYRR